MSEIKSTIITRLFEKWKNSSNGKLILESALTPEALCWHGWQAAIDAFGWKSTHEHGLPQEIGNYMAILQNNHIVHAQLLNTDPYNPNSRKVWTAAVYGELVQNDNTDYSFDAKYYFKQNPEENASLPLTAVTKEEVGSMNPETRDLVFSAYFVEGPLPRCYTPMINPPKRKTLRYMELSAKVVNDFGLGMTNIAYYRPLEMPE